jgi:hypothetical protein
MAAVPHRLGRGQQHRRQAEADHGGHRDTDLDDRPEVERLVGTGADADQAGGAGSGAQQRHQLGAAPEHQDRRDQHDRGDQHPVATDRDERQRRAVADHLQGDAAGPPEHARQRDLHDPHRYGSAGGGHGGRA